MPSIFGPFPTVGAHSTGIIKILKMYIALSTCQTLNTFQIETSLDSHNSPPKWVPRLSPHLTDEEGGNPKPDSGV